MTKYYYDDHIIQGGRIDNTPVGQRIPKKGAFTELKASTDPVDEHGVGDRGFNDARYTPKDLDVTTVTDPATDAAVTTAIVNDYGGVVITLTGAGNSQTLGTPTDATVIKRFIVVVKGAFDIQVNGITMTGGEAQWFIWDSASWVAIEAVDADDITFTPTGDIVATNIQSAIAEVDNEKVKRIVSVDNEIARFDSTGGDIQGYTSNAPTIADDGAVAIKNKITISRTGITGTDNQAIDIVGGEILNAEEHWTGIRVKPDDLDPNGADTRIRGMAINMSGITYSAANIPDMDGMYILMPQGHHGIHLAEGILRQHLTVDTEAGSEFTAYDLVIDGVNLNAASTIHAFDVAVSNGAPAGDVYALGTHANVGPVIQTIGSYSTPSQTEFAGRKTGGGNTWADGIDFVTTAAEVFVQNSDEIYIGVDSAADQFSEIEIVMHTAATRDLVPTFWYNTAADAWTEFFPGDDTDGFQNSGIVRWSLGDISGNWTNNGDPGVGDTTAGYWIKIIRTVGPDPGTPKIATAKTGTVINYTWDKNGDVNVADLTGLTPVITKSSSLALTAAECKGQIILVTGNHTITLPPVVIGAMVTLRATTAAVFHAKANASDRIILSGVALDDGDKASSPGNIGDQITLWGDSVAGWTEISMTGGFTDTGS